MFNIHCGFFSRLNESLNEAVMLTYVTIVGQHLIHRLTQKMTTKSIDFQPLITKCDPFDVVFSKYIPL